MVEWIFVEGGFGPVDSARWAGDHRAVDADETWSCDTAVVEDSAVVGDEGKRNGHEDELLDGCGKRGRRG